MGMKWEDLQDFESISAGNFGVIRKADYLGTDVAVKEFKQEKGFDLEKYVGRELDILKESRHPNVVQFMGVCNHEDKVYMVTEFVGGGNLKAWIKDTSKELTWRLRTSFALDIARALAYLHANKIIHRDLKSENLLITENLRLKLCDFGFSRETAITSEDRRRMSFCGTDDYMSPEIMLGMPFDEAVDIFSYGVILCELITRSLAEEHHFEREIPGFGINPETIHADEGCPPALKDLAIKCTDSEPEKRPLLNTILKSLKQLEAELYKGEATHPGLIGKSVWNLTTSINSLSSGPVTASDPNVAVPSSKITVSDSGSNVGSNISAGIPLEQVPTQNSLTLSVKNVNINSSNEGLVSPNPSINSTNMRRIAHWIPHRFSIQKTGGLFATCAGCNKRFGMGRKCLQCDDCHQGFHRECAAEAPATCGLPTAFKTSIILLDPSHHQSPISSPREIKDPSDEYSTSPTPLKSKSSFSLAAGQSTTNLNSAKMFGGSMANLFATRGNNSAQ